MSYSNIYCTHNVHKASKRSLLKGIIQEKDPISQASEIQWTTGKTVIKKWKKYGTTLTLQRTRCPSKSDEKQERNWSGRQPKRPTAAPKELQSELSDWLFCIWQLSSLFPICPEEWGSLFFLPFSKDKHPDMTKYYKKIHQISHRPVRKSILFWWNQSWTFQQQF